MAWQYKNAKLQPDGVAIQTLASDVTWAMLLTLVRRVAYKLRQLGVRPNQRVVTFLADPRIDWIVTLALMHEAVATCATPGPIPFEIEPDFVLATTILPQVPTNKMVLLDERSLKELPQPPEDFSHQAFVGNDSLFRLILTSGTTGKLKAAEFSVGTILRRCERSSPLYTTELSMMGFFAIGGFTAAMRALVRGGGFFLADTARDTIRLINTRHLECLSGSPHQLTAVIEELQRTSRRLSSLKLVVYAGGEASPTLMNNFRRDLCPTVLCLYGSTEAGTVSYSLVHDQNRQPGMAGYVVPEAEVQVVNEKHQPLGFGEEGTIRLKTFAMAGGYYKDQAETARFFRDGWFYPGDVGRLLKSGMLLLTGRKQELINRGGVRVSPVEIDFVIQHHEGVLDAATFGFENHLGLEDICAAVVVADDFHMEQLSKRLAEILPKHQNPSVLIKLKEIPRNNMGKPMRSQLREQHGEMLRQRLKGAA